MADTTDDRPDDYLHNSVMETSTDGNTWTTVGTYQSQTDINLTLSPNLARYVRFRCVAAQGDWVIVREFSAR